MAREGNDSRIRTVSPIEDIRPLSESERYSIFKGLAQLCRSAAEKDTELAQDARVRLPMVWAYKLGSSDVWRFMAEVLDRESAGGVNAPSAYIEILGEGLTSELDRISKLVLGFAEDRDNGNE